MISETIANRVKETTAKTGTGTSYTLAGAASGFVAFSAAVAASGSEFTVLVTDGTNWETFDATLTGGDVVRTGNLKSSNANDPVDWSEGTKEIAMVPTAEFWNRVVAEIASKKDAEIVPLVLILGESNSGGLGKNSDTTSGEIAARPAVQILNNTTLEFEALDIGTNNLLGHTGLTGVTDPDGGGNYEATRHGLELGLANSVEAGEWDASTVYLVKAGQGGSKIAEWNAGGTYMTTLATRFAAAVAELKSLGKTPVVYLWISLGINDEIAGTSYIDLKNGMAGWISQIREIVGFAPVVLTEFMADRPDLSASMQDLALHVPFCYSATADDLSLDDANHWDYVGLKTLAGRMVTASLNVGQGEAYIQSQAKGLQAGLPEVVFTAGGAELPENEWVNVSWVDTAHTADNGLGIIARTDSLTGAGARGDFTIDATQPFAFEMQCESLALSDTAILALSESADPDYAWQEGIDLLAGVHTYQNNIYAVLGGYNSTDTGDAVASYPCILRCVKDSDDLIYSVSYDSGESFTTIYTAAGVLADVETLYLKVVFPFFSSTVGDRITGRIYIGDLAAESGVLPVAEGGTGADNAADARTNLGIDVAIASAVTSGIAALVDSSPTALDTLNELAAALGDDANFASTMTTALAGKAATSHTHVAANVTDFNTAVGALIATAVGEVLDGATFTGPVAGTTLALAGDGGAGDALQVAGNMRSHGPNAGYTLYDRLGGTSTWFTVYVNDNIWSVFSVSGVQNVLILTASGDMTIPGDFSADNFSGSSSGANTGDQDLSGKSDVGHTHTISDVDELQDSLDIITSEFAEVYGAIASAVSVLQPLDGDLTAIAALGYTSGSYIAKKTAANTWSLIAITTAGEAILDDADAAAQRVTLHVATFHLSFDWSEPDDDTRPLIPKARAARTIKGIYGLKTSAGTCTVAIQIGGVNVTSLSGLSVSSTPQDVAASGANAVAIGDRVTVVVSGSSSPEDLEFTLELEVA